MKSRKLFVICSVLSSVLLSIPWLVPHLGFLALVGFVPLLCAERIAFREGTKHFWIWHYLTFVLWNAFTTFWVCNATVAGGLFAVFVNALQMSLVFGLFRFSRKRFTGILPYLFLMASWISWERLYFSAQISWPWLTLGNAFASSTELVQWYEITGSLGGSLWVWAVNLSLFGGMVALSDGSFVRWNAKAKTAFLTWLALIVAGPVVSSVVIGSKYEEQSEAQVDVLIGQPNFDPYTKFESMSQAEQNGCLLKLFSEAMAADTLEDPDLLVAPETFTSDVLLNSLKEGRSFSEFRNFLSSYPHTDLLFGAGTFEFINQRHRPDIIARPYGDGWMLSRNSAIIMDSSSRAEVFHKSKLVVGTELMPFPKLLDPIDKALGYVCGRCKGQDEISPLHLQDGTPFGCAICYESCFGEYCTDYVRKDAKFITVITNDAWWGNTPGYRQHFNYSRLRAIELRRDIARCGNTGISAFIDQKGNVVSSTQWWKPQTLRGCVNLNSSSTAFVKYGDVTGRVCIYMFLLMALLLFVRTVSGGRRPRT